jgi:hypothetical protein
LLLLASAHHPYVGAAAFAVLCGSVPEAVGAAVCIEGRWGYDSRRRYGDALLENGVELASRGADGTDPIDSHHARQALADIVDELFIWVASGKWFALIVQENVSGNAGAGTVDNYLVLPAGNDVEDAVAANHGVT